MRDVKIIDLRTTNADSLSMEAENFLWQGCSLVLMLTSPLSDAELASTFVHKFSCSVESFACPSLILWLATEWYYSQRLSLPVLLLLLICHAKFYFLKLDWHNWGMFIFFYFVDERLFCSFIPCRVVVVVHFISKKQNSRLRNGKYIISLTHLISSVKLTASQKRLIQYSILVF